MILDHIVNTYKYAKDRRWDTIYWAIDLHGTILESSYKRQNVDIMSVFDHVIPALLKLSEREDTKIYIFSCTLKSEYEMYMNYFKNLGVDFKWINENPEAKDTTYGCYRYKPYFNILLDDKAGFDPHLWKYIDEIIDWLPTIEKSNIVDWNLINDKFQNLKTKLRD
jgi:hypothetical protein